jgi:hypothetical protein
MDSFSRASSTDEDEIIFSIVVRRVLELATGAVKWSSCLIV